MRKIKNHRVLLCKLNGATTGFIALALFNVVFYLPLSFLSTQLADIN